MTKVISILIVAVFLYGGWQLYFYYERIQNQQDADKKQEASQSVMGDQLSGVPFQLAPSLSAAEARGAGALKEWLKTYAADIQDPRKAWIQLDYCVLASREDPAEARRVFAEVKGRLDPTSPVWPRIQRLEKTYQ